MREDSQKVVLALRAMGGESHAACREVLNDLIARGLRMTASLII